MDLALNKPMRYSLTVVGVLSGEAIRVKRTWCKHLVSVYHLLMLFLPIITYENISTSLRNPLIADYYKQPAIICLVIVSNFSSYQWIFIAGYISYTTYTLWILVCRFNEKLEEDMEGSRQQVLNSLHAYRSLHLQLCGVIESANDHMRLLLGTLFVFSTIVVLLMIYSTTYLKLVKLSAMIWFLYLAFTLIRSGWLMLIIFLCDRLAASMQLFLNQITKSEGFSAMGMMSVNKEFGLTVSLD
ncbi:hypothetical protein EB796_020289 [Bugula neritina]|uniref:Gustatory receptor n=1 Tax=Bugula neritina TaxID=10212 RepID=A0A7J7J675_BUGNE|nr:hypothetical protein EB796_020289 [Bugula neritina]